MDILSLAADREILVGLAIALICWAFGLISKGLAGLHSLYRKFMFSSYINAISFTEAETLFALKNYIKPKFSELDPSRCDEPRDAVSRSDKSLYRYVDKFIRSGDGKHLFIYADSGMGKTTFLINYFHRNRSRLLLPRRDMVLVSLSKSTSEVEIAATPLTRQRSTVLLLDALDEDPYIYGNTMARVNRLLELSANYKAVIITCRSQFFSDDSSLPLYSGVLRSGPTPAAESKEYAIERVYISPFNDKQIAKYLRSRLPGLINALKRYRARELVDKVPYLPVRPMLLAHISDVLALQKEIKTHADIYQAIVSSWARREVKWISLKELMDFSSDLAFELYLNRQTRGGESCSIVELEQLAEVSGIRVETSSLTGRSLLNRTSDGAIKFSHRSILEYFVANRVSSAAAGLSLQLTSQMLVFLFEIIGASSGDVELNLPGREIKLTIISPESKLGYSTNFNLFKRGQAISHLTTLMAAPIRALDGVEYHQTLFSDLVSDLISFAGVSGEVEIRVMIPLSRSTDWMSCYVSVWADRSVGLSHIRMDTGYLRAALGFTPDREICLIGVGASVERMGWSCEFRSDLLGSPAQMESSPRVAFFMDSEGAGVEMYLISGRAASGPLASFGILSGGSYLPLERRIFTRLPQIEISNNDRVGAVVEQETAKIAASERWNVRKSRAKGSGSRKAD